MRVKHDFCEPFLARDLDWVVLCCFGYEDLGDLIGHYVHGIQATAL